MRLLLHIGLPGALVLSSVATGREHWSLQPVVRPDIPVHGIEDPIFFLVGQRLEQAGLVSAPTARRRDWIRRLFYNLTGLPPTYERLKSLVAFPGSDAALAAGLVEDLLSSPHYGERWARHWLDVARYSDTKGYAYAGEEFGGVEPANFLDIGGGASAEVMANGLDIVLNDPDVQAVFVNVFGGITACDAVANGIVNAMTMLEDKGEPVTKPIVCRIDGNNAEEGRRILNEAEHDLIELVETMDDAARRVAELAASRAAGK